jgi:ATP-binding cassette subfamily C protein LapB
MREVGAACGEASTVSIIQAAWKAGRLAGAPEALPHPRPVDCPFSARQTPHGWMVVLSQNGDGSWLAQPSSGGKVRIDTLDDMACVTIPTKITASGSTGKSAAIIWKALLKYRSVFGEALLATFLINFLTLVTSIYSLQVYDRVIPHNGFQTLFVLTVGVLVALIFDFILKQVRGLILDKTTTQIDLELSEWFFERAMGIHLSSRPQSVGTLASQLKGLEMVRGVLSSASIFLMADVPFAFFLYLSSI